MALTIHLFVEREMHIGLQSAFLWIIFVRAYAIVGIFSDPVTGTAILTLDSHEEHHFRITDCPGRMVLARTVNK
jgi:hypothetical protein